MTEYVPSHTGLHRIMIISPYLMFGQSYIFYYCIYFKCFTCLFQAYLLKVSYATFHSYQYNWSSYILSMNALELLEWGYWSEVEMTGTVMVLLQERSTSPGVDLRGSSIFKNIKPHPFKPFN